MNITSQHTRNPKVKIVDVLSELTGNAAVNFQRSSYKYLDEGECCLLLNLKHVRKIDGLGFMVLEQFINRGGHIRLFNVGAEIRCMLRISGKDSLFKICSETDYREVASMFEKEELEEDSNRDGIKKRHYPRVDTSFQAGFKYRSSHNGVVSGNATLRNLSEGGAFADQIMAINMENGETINQPKIGRYGLYDIKFRLNGESELIETKGECVREIRTEEKHYVSIHFNDMKQGHKEMIRDFVVNA